MRVLLVSTYELGHQPLHVAAPAAVLLEAGHGVRAVDLAVEPLRTEDVDWAEVAAISVPMHTAMRLGVRLAARLRARRPRLPLAMYGLYAAVGADRTVGALVDRAIAGEYLSELLAWVSDPGGEPGVTVDLSAQRSVLPARHLLPPLERYAHLEVAGEHRLVGYLEASHGCRHRCRHCPIPAVYDGRYRIVDMDAVLADMARLVELGARHVTFGDPDFLNGPHHALRVLEAAHAEFPELTFDVTAKVEHLRRHAGLLPRLAEAGVVFVVSAFETVDDRVLGLLDKGHTVADMTGAVEECRRSGLDLHPSWLPFTPWTRVEDVAGIFRFLDRHELLDVTDPVQLSIRLLVPDGSLLLDLPEMAPHLDGYDPEGLTHRWRAAHPGADRLQSELAAIAARAADAGAEPGETLVALWRRALAAAGADEREAQIPAGAISGRPRLTEPWFC